MAEIGDELKRLIEENPLALATVDEKGNLHCIAVAFVKFVSENQILITDNYMTKTRENILRNPNVALVVWNKDWEENCVGYELKGVAEYFTEGEWYEKAKQIPENEGEPCKGVVLVTLVGTKKLA